jgi:hypothetical protein
MIQEYLPRFPCCFLSFRMVLYGLRRDRASWGFLMRFPLKAAESRLMKDKESPALHC